MTTSSTPTYAYVKYHDGAKAIVHVSLIKKYSPSSVDDLAKKKMVYWCSTSSQEAKHSDEDFYMADVVELGLTKGDLIRRLVHLGNGVWVEKERWELLLGRDRDSLFCKELAKLVWGVPALRGRSVTGAPCRRYLKEGNAIEKPALSPHKLEAVGNINLFVLAAAYARFGRPIQRPIQNIEDPYLHSGYGIFKHLPYAAVATIASIL
ncbi:hypothetical protein HPB52_009419 [Rhipicephalus sanguineus]|uniref:Uncharacterized protein n=1 Tax=Rhipicephalus sanguineus TaxID=34632 RepID=A0A9D4PI12_RHISA|nr:hypothetical protein HPB52_009419 [Rhipicephalus sanguineus]